MSQNLSQFDDDETAKAYFYALVKSPATPAPTDLDQDTAALIRRLVANYQAEAQPSEMTAAKARVWQRFQADKAAGELVLTADRPGAPDQPTSAEQWQVLDPEKTSVRPKLPTRQRIAQWGRWTTMAGLAASIALVVGLLVLIVVLNAGSSRPDNSPSGNLTAAASLTTSPTPTPIGFSLTLSPTPPTDNDKALEDTRALIEQRLNGVGLTDSKVTIENKNIVITVKGTTDRTQLLRLVGVGRLEVIQVGSVTLSDGQMVCTTASIKLTQCASNINPPGLRGADGQPFKTIVSSDMLDKGGLANGNQGSMAALFGTLAGSSNFSDEFKRGYVNQTLAIVLDGQALTGLPLNQLFADRTGNNSNLLNTPQAQAEITLLTTLLKYGQLPLQLKIVNLQPIYS